MLKQKSTEGDSSMCTPIVKQSSEAGERCFVVIKEGVCADTLRGELESRNKTDKQPLVRFQLWHHA